MSRRLPEPVARSRRWRRLPADLAALCGAVSMAAWAQADPPAPAPPPPPPSEVSRLDPVEVTGSRPDEMQERRQSTAAKTIVGRDEIARYGDMRLTDVLKRLPGITTGGPGGGLRMRGLSEGYVLILLDGERLPPGFSLDALSPDQIERIEILRAPSAETGAQAIGGTINIVTRGGWRRRVNDVRLAMSASREATMPQATWSRNAKLGDVVLNGTLTASASRTRGQTSFEDVQARRLADDALLLQRDAEQTDDARWRSVNASGRVEWKLPEGLGQLTLTPLYTRSRSDRRGTREVSQPVGGPPPYDREESSTASDLDVGRLNSTWMRLLPDGRVEVKLNLQQQRVRSTVQREQALPDDAGTRAYAIDARTRDRTLTTGIKVDHGWRPAHTLVAGAEVERGRRDDHRTSTVDGMPLVTGYADAAESRVTRTAAYLQDDWELNPHWSAQLGVRWEQTRTDATAAIGEPSIRSRNAVWTPLAHVLWKVDAKGRDQVRLSLTRSYKAPDLYALVARPRINGNWPAPGSNTPTEPDFAGNAELRPQLATGLDLSFEHQLPGNGLLSASVFSRRIRDYVRIDTMLETVPWSDVPRYVSRPRNVGGAVTRGLELEAKFRASELWSGAPATDLRANASVHRSRVDGVPGPDNRLDNQPSHSAGLGVDHRFKGWPLAAGGTASWTPGYRTQLSATQSATISGGWQFDGYALWTLDANMAARFSVIGIGSRDWRYSSTVEGPDADGTPVRETSARRMQDSPRVTLRLEMKL